MKKIFILAILLNITTVFSNAQTKISGIVATQSDSETIIGAVIEVYKADSTLVISTQTDSKGRFSLDLSTFDKLKLKVRSLGFHDESIIISGKSKSINLGYIYLLDNSIELKEVTVEGHGIIEKVDKYIVIPSLEQIKRSARSVDLLKNLNLPGLDVNIQSKSTTILGLTPVYQINGVPKSETDVLALNPENILRVEYSDNPGIRYIGRGGVINFILKQQLTGGTIFEDLSASPTCGAIDNITSFAINYKKSEFSIYYHLHWRDYYKTMNNSYTEWIGQEYPIYRESLGKESTSQFTNNNIIANYTYQHDLNTIFNAKFTYSIRPGHGSSYSDISNVVQNKIEKYESNSQYNFNDNAPALDLFWKKKFKGENILELNIVGTYIDLDHKRELVNTFTDRDGIFPSGVKNKKWSIITEAAYSKNFKKIKMSFGAYNNYSKSNNKYIEPENITTNFDANDTYVYGQIIGKLKKVSYTVGTGLKMFTMQDDTKGRTYYNNQSIIRLLYTPVKKFTIDFLSMYQPRLPNLSQLDNIIQTSDDILKNSGNPDLKPYNYFRNRITLKYTYDKVWTRLWAIYDYEMNPIITTTTYNGSYFLSKPINSNYSSKFNLQYDLGVERLWNHLDLRGSIIWNKYISDNENFHHTMSNIKLNFQATAYFGRWTITGSYDPLTSKVLIGELIHIIEPKYQLMVEYNWKNFYFSIMGSSLFEKQGQIFRTESLSKVNPGKSSNYIIDNANWITLGVVYRLNFGRKFNKSSKSLNNVDTEGSAVTIK